MEVWELAYYEELGRYVVCPACGNHSDLGLDWPAAPEDPIPTTALLHSKAVKGCTIFHQEPLIAWLWFKYHTRPPGLQLLEYDDHFGPAEEITQSSEEPNGTTPQL